MIKDIPVLARYVDDWEKPNAYDFFRCHSCGRLFTRDQELAGFAEERGACACGSLKYKPSNPVGLDWIRPNVVSYVIKLVLARGLAPWCERRFPSALPFIGWLVE